MYFLSSLRAETAKALICRKSGVSADSRKSAKKCGKPHFLHALFGTLSGIGENPTFSAD